MSRRSVLPGADELFRSTDQASGSVVTAPAATTAFPGRPGRQLAPPGGTWGSVGPGGTPPAVSGDQAPHDEVGDEGAPLSEERPSLRVRRRPRDEGERRPSGRERHEDKITVYVSPEELMDLEHARLTLRGEHGLAIDRGRIVREALAVVIADLEARGEASILVRRLLGR